MKYKLAASGQPAGSNQGINMHTVQVGEYVKVEWSNGNGYSMFRVVDNPGNGPHLFELVEEFELCGNGEFVKVN